MNTQAATSPQFYLTAPAPCPYLAGEMERKVFTHLVGPRAPEMNDLLTQGGFRRSQNIAYRPACETCRACISVRIVAREFQPNRTMRRVAGVNADLTSSVFAAQPSTEQFSLFRTYLDHRHQQGGMSDMSALDFAIMVEDSHVKTKVIEYRLPKVDEDSDRPGELVAVALSDILSDGLSMVYSFFNPVMEKRSLGTFMVLDHIRRANEMGLPHVYLGYWVNGSRKMGYKIRFLPQEHLLSQGWTRYEPESGVEE
ncbi:arginyltransferase [Agrobacterium vitis]|uniref:Aspartate/glutamate leucyltransferase n=1 Tax=Agrobacterium vitis TaxID=373 RepID=A0A368NV52_AGRVI|nr:arginyltransferase [Agrobacterium vitis]KAA3519470.1 arginyltransferase [Agrobacterium vitis]KAA3532319.1 arginyltransferase [Agrobacterium vitis]MCF1475593.1 arginyltransferase [Agrobacterium vitis]MUZ95173.1 arginyltransferase [Agrobacterium vitis]MVA29641.1 arginyltransferase [Agrobacterium vitis]